MGILRRLVGLFFVLGIFITAVFAQDVTSTPSAGNIVVVESAFVRSGPSDDFVPVGALYAGDRVFPLNISEDGLWILIPYSRSNGWIQRNLVQWEDDAALDLLPVMLANITPTPRIEVTNTPFIPTFTPEGNYVNPNNAQSVYVRAGPGRGYLRLGQLRPSDTVLPVARNEDSTWIMIRFQLSPLREGFGWVATDLITWQDFDSLNDLPIVLETNLTPTATFTASITPSPSETSAPSSTASASPTASATLEPSLTPSATTASTETPEPIATNTMTATETPTSEPSTTPSSTTAPTETATLEPSATNTVTASPTNSPEPSETPSPSTTPSETPSPAIEPSATASETSIPTETPTTEPSATATESPTTEAALVVVFPSATPTNAPTNTPSPSATASETVAPTDIFAVQNTVVAVNTTLEPTSAIEPTPPPFVEEIAPQSGFSIPLEAIVGLIALILVAIYIGLYMQGLNAASRYKAGFVVEKCPVCQRGHLHVEERPNRLLGIPTVRRTVRCDECRSVLRETGNRRWRYAVDRIENPVMFDRFNGREVTDADLERLLKQPPKNASARTNPTFVDDEQGN